MRNILPECSTTLFLNQQSTLNSFLLIAPEYSKNWDSNNRGDDGKNTVTPVPATGLEEGLSGSRTDKGGDDVRSGGEGENQSSILQRRSVGHEDIKNVSHAIEPDPVKDLGCRESLNIRASSHHNKT